uniref:Tetratricopeptide repeat protein 37 n=1 Tax=Aceria tosichella TaxID=561515 RepID=A0A6G1S8X1_9ACAR
MDESQDREVKSEQEVRLEQANKLFQTSVMLIYGKRKSVEKAIKCIQKAIVLDDSNYRYWQLLGEAYYQRGSLNPSINCFMKSLTLAENYLANIDTSADDCTERTRVRADSTYSRLRMSDIRLSVQHLDEAMNGYSDIIGIDPENVAALVGMSRAELLMARKSFHSGLVKSGHAHCMNALKYALRSIKLSPHLCFTWKLASDCCLIQAIYGQRGEFSTNLAVFDFPGGNQDGLVVTRLSCIELAQQFLCKALTISPYEHSPSLWHNLGISLYLRCNIATQLKSNERQALLKRALKCLIKALDYDRINSQVRNSIAIVAYQLDLLNTSQNFLIKSIQTNMSTSEIQFSNLGYIFLQKGEFRLASVAFKRCQAEEPLYCRSWLGNALVNEQNNLDNMSLLRHCYKLENNYESQMMYATKITSLPYTEEYSKDLINALDCMKRIINYDERSLAAQNTLGLLYERSGFKTQAKRCFQEAYLLAPDDSRAIFNRLRQHSTQSTGCMIELNSAEQLDANLLKAAEKLADRGNLEYMLNFVYYLFINCDYRSINTRITKVIDKLPQNDVRNKVGAQVLLAMIDKVDGKDYKSWLFKNIIDSEGLVCLESMINLFCLMLFGSVTNDQQLIDQVSGDLSKYLILYLSAKTAQFSDVFYSLEGIWLRLTLAASIFCNPDQGKLLRPMVALFPNIAELWLFLGLSLMFHKQKYQTAMFCIKKANLIGSTNADLSVICDILLAISPSKPTGRQSKKATPIDPNLRVVHLSRALFKCPDYKLLWDCLNAAKFQDTTRELPKNNQPLTGYDAELFQLAVDHTIRMITS